MEFRVQGLGSKEAFDAATSGLLKITMCVRDPSTQAPTTYVLKINDHTKNFFGNRAAIEAKEIRF